MSTGLEKGMTVSYAELSRLVGKKINAARTSYVRFVLQRDSNHADRRRAPHASAARVEVRRLRLLRG